VSISKAAEAVVVCVCALTFALMVLAICMLLITGNGLVHHDAMSFWTAGQLLAHGENPYDPAGTLRIQRAAGLDTSFAPLILRNPPFALAAVAALRPRQRVRGCLLLEAPRLLELDLGRRLAPAHLRACSSLCMGERYRACPPCSDVLGHQIPLAHDADGSCSADGSYGRRGPARDTMAFATLPMASTRMAALVSLQSRSCIRGEWARRRSGARHDVAADLGELCT
jgi:hypothetical protein